MSQFEFGWLDRPDAVDLVTSQLPIPLFQDVPLVDQGDALLYLLFRQAVGRDAPWGPQLIGDCGSWMGGNFVNYVSVLQTGQFDEACTEWVYGSSRVEIGDQRGSYQDGTTGAWVFQALSKMGVLPRSRTGPYDPKRAKEWGAKGVPDNMEPEAKISIVKTISKVTSYEQARIAISNKCPVGVCSSQGFTLVRDQQGFCAPQGKWMHAMLFVGSRSDRPGLCCLNWWGKDKPSGPVALDQPPNSFWVDADVADRMLKQGDSWTGSAFTGYKQVDWAF